MDFARSLFRVMDAASFLLTLIILFICVWNRDGIACMALVTLSLVSSIAGLAFKGALWPHGHYQIKF